MSPETSSNGNHLVADINGGSESQTGEHNDSYLHSVLSFLRENAFLKILRKTKRFCNVRYINVITVYSNTDGRLSAVIKYMIHAAFLTGQVKYVIHNQFPGHKNAQHA